MESNIQKRLLFFSKQLVYVISYVIDIIRLLCRIVLYMLSSSINLIVGTKEKDITGQVVLITGGGNGLGKALSIRFAERRAKIAIADIDLKSAEKTAVELRSRNIIAKSYKCDISNQNSIETMKKQVLEDFGHIDILVNNAGLVDSLSFKDCYCEELEKMVQVNFVGSMLMTKAFLSEMIANKTGHIVTISSMSGIYAFPTNITYSATKFGVNGFMLALTEYLRTQKLNRFIKTTCVMPVFIDTRPLIDKEYRVQGSRVALLTVNEAADSAIKGILQEQVLFSIPSNYRPLISLMNTLPVKLQQVVRDVIIKDTRS